MRRVWGIGILLLVSLSLIAKEDIKPRRYYRSALTSMMVYHPEDEFGYDVYQIFKDLPVSDKFDEHEIGYRVIDRSYVEGQINGETILNELEKGQVAKRIVAKWYDWSGDSVQNAFFGTKTIEERSDYNVSFMDAEKVRYTIEGSSSLRDVGVQLMQNSFVLVSNITYRTVEDKAKSTKETLSIIGGIADILTGGNEGRRFAQAVGEIADLYTGFKVITTTYLYQLEWNREKMNDFFVHYYTEEPNEAKMRAFIADTSLFHLRYLGTESSMYEQKERKGKYDRTELLQLITARSIDMNIAALQTKYEAFRIKSPITSVEYNKRGKVVGYRALIGEKEDVKNSSEFEILEAEFEQGRLTFNKVGTAKVVNNRVWDNRFNALKENNIDISVEGTLFKSKGRPSKTIVPGMLLRLKKQ